MRVLGVDPGLTRCGLGAVDTGASRSLTMVAVGVERSAPTMQLDARLLHMASRIGAWLDEFEPDAVAVERVFAQHNLMTVTGTAQVAGIAIVEAARRGVAVAVHTPTEVKAAVTGSGRAGKEQVQRMVARLLGLPEIPRPPDAADALALAICHAWKPVGLTPETGTATPAQRAWLEAERAARRRTAPGKFAGR